MTFGRTIDLTLEEGSTNIILSRDRDLDFNLALPLTDTFRDLCAELLDAGPIAVSERMRKLSEIRKEEVEAFFTISAKLLEPGSLDAKEQMALGAAFLAMFEGLEACGYEIEADEQRTRYAVRTLDSGSRKELLGITDKTMKRMRAACPELWVFIQMLSMATSAFSEKDADGGRYGAFPPFLLVFLYMGFQISRVAAGGDMAGKKVQMAKRSLPMPCATCHGQIVRGQRFYFGRDHKGAPRPFHEAPCPERTLQIVPAVVAASEAATTPHVRVLEESQRDDSPPQLPTQPVPPPQLEPAEEPQDAGVEDLELVRLELEEALKSLNDVRAEHTVELNQLRVSHQSEITLLRQQKAQSCPPLDPEMVDSIFWKSLYERTNSALIALSDRNKIVEERFRFVCKENNRLRKNTEKMARVVKQLRKVAIETIENL